ncbi:Npt1/Npt2 family nucleotide transporter [Winogradskyella litorisediminis]|uniref:Npt1/Npt2 family nucleotide transporter n=1 Tax=Winogradskyella litorisediminis TaxID=1156618 RepID=A0ABW3N2X2_9FLAO
MLKRIFKTTFGLRDGEIHISFLMQLYIFLIITVLLIIKPNVNALFLSRLGSEQLPIGYILVAFIAVIVTYFYNKWVRRFSFRRVAIITLVFFGLSFLLLGLAIKLNFIKDWVLYVYYIGVSLFAVITTSQFWILANLVFNSREAKRLFGFIGAGAIAGGVFGGYLTSIIASKFGIEISIIVASVFLLLCIPIIQKIYKLKVNKLNMHMRAQRRSQDAKTNLPSYKVVAKSKHLTFLAIITGVGVIVAKLVDFQFSDIAHNTITDSDELASFFGFWFSTFNLLALGLQLFLTNKILSKLGVSSTLLILPLGIAFGSLLFLIFPELWVLVIIKGIDGSFKQSLNKAAFELSIIPIPFTIKNQAKSFIDVAVDSIATGLAGLMLIFIVKRFNLSSIYITVIILLLVFLWIILIYKLRETYFHSFRLNIQRNLATTSNQKISRKNKSVDLKRIILKSDNEIEILTVLDRLSAYKIKSLKTEITNLLHHPSYRVKVKAIQQLYSYDKGASLSDIEPLIHSSNAEVSHAALAYVLEYSQSSQQSFFEEYLNHHNKTIASAALLCLAEEIGDNKSLDLKFHLKHRIETNYRKALTLDDNLYKEDIAKLMLTIAHARYEKYYSYININLIHDNPYIVKHAIKAAGITADDMFAKPLIHFISDKTYRKQAIKALREYSSKITDTLLKLSLNDEINTNAQRHIPLLIRSFKNQQSVKILTRFLKNKDVFTRLEAAKALIKLKSKQENLYFNKRRFKKEIFREYKYAKQTVDALSSMQNIIHLNAESKINTDETREIEIAREAIVKLLEEQLNTSLKCIFKLLGILYDEADIEVSYSGLISDVKEAKINALEFLDNLLQSQIKTQILPLIEYYSIEAESQTQNNELSINILAEPKLIEMLFSSRSKRMKLELLYLIRLLKDKSYIRLVQKQTIKTSKEVRIFATDTASILLDNF